MSEPTLSLAGPVAHRWCRGQAEPSPSGPALASIDAHRRRRGPYSAAGELVRLLVPEALASWPDLVDAHDIEVRAVAPELAAVVPGRRETLTSTATPQERTRFYPAGRTLRLAHGLTEFVLAFLDLSAALPSALVVANADEADPTDLEWLAVMVRRVPAHRLRLVIGTRSDTVPEPLAEALALYAESETGERVPPSGPGPDLAGPELAAAYVRGDCARDDPAGQAAYEALSAGERASLHDAWADALEASAEFSWRLGAVPFHRERGDDPAGAGAAALEAALEHCMLMGYYDAVISLGRRGLALRHWDDQPEACWLITTKLCTAFGALGRPDEAAELYDDACASTTHPSVHLQSAYGRAMLLTRFYDQPRQDHRRAKAAINTAIAISSLVPEAQRRAFNLTFNENGLALVEMHLGDLEESLRLVTEGLDRLDRDLDPHGQTLHRSVLLSNQAQLLVGLGRLDEGLGAYTRVIEADPHHSEYYFERAGLLRRLGRIDAAMADYAAAIHFSPPYPEPHYNRADLLLERGDVEGALAGFDYVLELDPAFADARVNRASLRYELGDVDGAAADVAAGLAHDPGQAHLWCLRGLLAQDDGRLADAGDAFDTALGLDPSLTAAWGNRAVVAFEMGAVAEALALFDGALALEDNPDIRSNRGRARQHAGHFDAAVADYDVVLAGELDGDTRAELLYQRDQCLLAQSDGAEAMSNF